MLLPKKIGKMNTRPPFADEPEIDTSNEKILQFLNDGLASVPAATENGKLGQQLMELWGDTSKRGKLYKTMVKILDRIIRISPDHQERVLVDELLRLLANWKEDKENVEQMNEISDKIWSLNEGLSKLKDAARFLTKLALKEFGGTLHCEALLSLMLHEATRKTMVADEYRDLLEQTKVDCNLSML